MNVSEFLTFLKSKVPDGEYLIWLSDLEFKHSDVDQSKLEVLVPGQVVKRHLEKRYAELIRQCFEEMTGQLVSLEFKEVEPSEKKVQESEFKKSKENFLPSNDDQEKLHTFSNDAASSGSDEGYVSNGIYHSSPKSKKPFSPGRNFDQNFTFDRYVRHKNNQLAFDVAEKVLTNYSVFNPVFFFGSFGTGKTHLLQAIGRHYKNHYDYMKVEYITPSDLRDDYAHACYTKNFNQFRYKYRTCDLLLLDDIQFLLQDSMKRTTEEFFYIFNAIYQNSKQIVLASDRPPAELNGLDDRLKSRLTSSVIVEIEKPEKESRRKILDFYLKEAGVDLKEGVKEFIADHISADARTIIGAVRTLVLHSQISYAEIDIPYVIRNVDALKNSGDIRDLSAEQILVKTARFGNLSLENLKSPKKTQNIAYYRQIAMYLMRRYTKLSFNEIGFMLGGKNSATVHAAVARVETKLKEDYDFQGVLETIIKNG